MNNRKKLLVSIGVILLVMILVSIFAFRQEAQSSNSNKANQQDDDAPIADFNAPESSNPKERELRAKRGNKYRTATPLQKMADQPIVLQLPQSHTPPENPLPIQRSDFIIIGTVVESRAFITNDKTGIYSEFDIKVEQVIKKVFQSNSQDNLITVERVGGYVRFPSGLKQKRGELGHNLPQKNKTYIFFLKWNIDGEGFLILTGYEIQGQQVYPLDGLKRTNPKVFRGYEQFKNANLNSFMSNLQMLLTNPSQGGLEND